MVVQDGANTPKYGSLHISDELGNLLVSIQRFGGWTVAGGEGRSSRAIRTIASGRSHPTARK